MPLYRLLPGNIQYIQQEKDQKDDNINKDDIRFIKEGYEDEVLQGKVGGIGAIVGRTRLLLVLVWTGNLIGQLARTLKHLSDIVRTVCDFIALGDGFGGGFIVSDSNERAEGNAVHTVA